MGGSHSREGLDLSDYSNDEDDYKSQSDSEQEYKDAQEYDHKSSSAAVDDLDLTNYNFIKLDDDVTNNVSDDDENEGRYWYLKVGTKIRVKVRVSTDMKLKMLAEQKQVDFVHIGVWAMSDENKVKVYGKDFMGWAKPELAYGTMWETNEDTMWENSSLLSFKTRNDLLEEFEEVAVNGGMIRSVALGFEEFAKGIVDEGESNMLLMSGEKEGKPHSSGVNQLDIKTGKIVTEWKFEKDGTEISMRDIEN
ncbi:CYPRO4 protein, partial [Tanacetum coccineum]